MKRVVTFDFETRSANDLRKSGAYKYSLDSTTQATCMAFKEHGKNTVYLLDFEMINRDWIDLELNFKEMWQRFIDEGFLFSAHNAFFETCIYKNILVKRLGWPDISFNRFRCTAAKAAACALPRNLEGAGSALKLSTQKDKRGYIAMMMTCKPTKQWTAWRKARDQVAMGRTVRKRNYDLSMQPEPPKFLEPHHNPQVWGVLYRYCRIDVRTEELLDDTLPDLIPEEQNIWFLNQRLNWRGLKIDIPTVQKIVGIMERESRLKLKELDALTMGLVTKPGARQSILDFLALEGIILPNIQAKTVEDVLKNDNLDGDIRRLLEIKQALSKSSTKKYYSFIDRCMPDGRARDILLFHGAHTGRDTGVGLQPHNFPRGLIKVDKDRPYAPVENVIRCDEEMLHLLYGESLAILFSSILRNMIIPSEGCELYVADFSKIEVAVLWWLSGNKPGLKILHSGLDPYIYMASANTGKTYEEVEQAIARGEKWAEDARQLGKAQVLGCGFGMAWEKFQTTAHDQYRLKLTDDQSQDAVKSYRGQNESVPELWRDYEKAAIETVKTGRRIKVGKCIFSYSKNFLWIELPSGRKLAYRDPQISWRVREYTKITVCEKTGKKTKTREQTRPKETLEYWAVNSKTKKWALHRSWGGTLTENIVQAVARDLMMGGMVRLENRKFTPLLMVHDEGICEKKKGTATVEEFSSILCTRPKWADKHLPLDAKGWKGPRYRK